MATDWFSATIAIATTTVSAAIAVLLAWNDHFHHRDLWIQRSEVLGEINVVRRRFAMRSSLPWYLRRPADAEAVAALQELKDALTQDLQSWKRIQGR
ncbi:hypothetical protein ACFXQA_11360 [Microbacterium sp. P07]|uniref:hypothetical protein n=1 Tax=Microbacterium sp. P07 TaxID=3366952 RepID=UPI0037469A6A